MSLSAARWQEMDYDSDGFIVFPGSSLHGVSSALLQWVHHLLRRVRHGVHEVGGRRR